MSIKKDLNYYLELPYTVEITPIKEEEGGGYMASLPQIGRFAIVGDGETIEEALQSLEEIKRERFSTYIENNTPIPEPTEDVSEYSGRFVVRIPKVLHKALVHQAKINEASLNQYVTYLLTMNLEMDKQKIVDRNIFQSLGFNIPEKKVGKSDDYKKAA